MEGDVTGFPPNGLELDVRTQKSPETKTVPNRAVDHLMVTAETERALQGAAFLNIPEHSGKFPTVTL